MTTRPHWSRPPTGKHLFYVFGDLVVHIHFGMSGQFGVHALPGPETKPTTRLRLECAAEKICAHLSAMTARDGSPSHTAPASYNLYCASCSS